MVVDTIDYSCAAKHLGPVTTYHYIYYNAKSGSLLRQLAVTRTAYYVDDENLVKLSEYYPPGMLLDFSAFLLHTRNIATFYALLSDHHVPLDGTSPRELTRG